MKYFISKRVVLEQKVVPAGILVENGKIAKIIEDNYIDFCANLGDIEVGINA